MYIRYMCVVLGDDRPFDVVGANACSPTFLTPALETLVHAYRRAATLFARSLDAVVLAYLGAFAIFA